MQSNILSPKGTNKGALPKKQNKVFEMHPNQGKIIQQSIMPSLI
jgi:hypothetical protein